LTWNGKALLQECLSSLASQTYSEKEVIVVDNGSTDGTLQVIKDTWSTLVSRVIENPFNTGFAKGCNQGIQASRGELVAFLNNDCRAQPGWIETMVKAALAHPEAGMFACKILLSQDPSVIDNAGHLLFPDGLNFSRGRLEKDMHQYDRNEEVFFPSGAASMFRKELLLDIQGLDEDFFAYGDDADLGLRARLRGWSCLYIPDAVVYHRHSATAGGYSPLKAYLVERNRIWVAVKCLPAAALALSPFYSLVRYCLQAYGAITGKGAAGRFSSPFALLWVLVRAWAGALRGLPRMWAKRREIQGNKRITAQEFLSLMQRFRIRATKISLTP